MVGSVSSGRIVDESDGDRRFDVGDKVSSCEARGAEDDGFEPRDETTALCL